MFLLGGVRNPSNHLRESGQPGALILPLPPIAARPGLWLSHDVSGEAAFCCENGGLVQFTFCHGAKVQSFGNVSKQLCCFLFQISKCNN